MQILSFIIEQSLFWWVEPCLCCLFCWTVSWVCCPPLCLLPIPVLVSEVCRGRNCRQAVWSLATAAFPGLSLCMLPLSDHIKVLGNLACLVLVVCDLSPVTTNVVTTNTKKCLSCRFAPEDYTSRLWHQIHRQCFLGWEDLHGSEDAHAAGWFLWLLSILQRAWGASGEIYRSI